MNRQKERKCNPFPQAQTQTRHSLISLFPVCAYLWFYWAEFPEGAPLTLGLCSHRRPPPQHNLLPHAIPHPPLSAIATDQVCNAQRSVKRPGNVCSESAVGIQQSRATELLKCLHLPPYPHL